MVQRRSSTTQSYKPVRTAGGLSGNKMFLCSRDNQYPTATRQSISGCIREQVGGNKVNTSKSYCPRSLGLVRRTQSVGDGGTYSRKVECRRGLGIKKQHRLQFMEVRSTDISTNKFEIQIASRSVRRQELIPTTELLELETGSGSSRNGCFYSSMEKSKSICLPSILPDRQMSIEDNGGGSGSPPHCSSMAKPILVPTTSSDAACTTHNFSAADEFTSEPDGPHSPPGGTKQTPSCGMASLGESTKSDGLSQDAEIILSNSIRPKTRKSYNSAWGNFLRWCSERSLDSIQATPEIVVDYLASLHKKGLAYRTINLHRSAISYFTSSLNKASLGSLPLVTKFMKGSFNLKPPLPRYTSTWDPTIVLNYLDNLEHNDMLTLEQLTKKLVCLLALCKASRSSDLCALDLTGYRETQSGVVFSHVHLRKTSKINFLPESYYPKYPDNRKLCVVDAIKMYIEKTAELRKSPRFLIATRKPYKSVSSKTVARWILDFMGKSGVNVSLFKSHSIRSASTSLAYQRGVSLSDIQKSADWGSTHTFFKFYLRPTDTGSFCHSVISSKYETLNVGSMNVCRF